MKEYRKKIKDSEVDALLLKLHKLVADVHNLREGDELKVYSNRQVCRMLGIGEKLLARYRNDGLMPYSRVGDKYWYTEKDLDTFINRTR